MELIKGIQTTATSSISEIQNNTIKNISEIQVNAIKGIVEIQKSTTDTILAIFSQNNLSDQSTESSHPLFNDMCAFCKKTGHWVQYCPIIPSKYRNFCYRCWKSDNHSAKNCTFKQQKPPWLCSEV